MATIIKVDNLKCGGCANTITKNILIPPEVYKAEVYPEKNEVMIGYDNSGDPDLFKEQLRKSGYPERGTTTGIEKINTNLESYLSGAVGEFYDRR